MRVRQAGYPAVLALLGTPASPCQLALLRTLPCITLLLDGDLAGARATCQLLDALRPTVEVRTARLPPHAGPADLTDPDLASAIALAATPTLRAARA